MGRKNKKKSSQQLYEDILNGEGIFEPPPEEEAAAAGGCTTSAPPFFKIFAIQLFALLLYTLPWITDRGNKRQELKRDRRPFEEKVEKKLSSYMFRRIYRMTNASFHKLHDMLEPRLSAIFFPRGGGKRQPGKSAYLIDTKTRLSIAIRFFAGADPYDIMQIHDVSLVSVYYSVWGVIDAINTTEGLAYHFPDHNRQREIAEGFRKKSGAGFDKIVGAIDGLIICTLMPPIQICREINCGQANFRCHRKDKYGLNLQAICDHTLRFTWVEMKWPAATSDYMAWITSSLCMMLEDNEHTKKILDGFTLIGDCAYVKKLFMAIPLKGIRGGFEDAYNFYLSQLRITIERAFGVFVHRWAILRAPLTIPLPKVAPLVESLVRLHNFCIDENELDVIEVRSKSYANLDRNVRLARQVAGGGCVTSSVVDFDDDGRPVSLLGHGHHFTDAESYRHDRSLQDTRTPMDDMISSVAEQGLLRPRY